MTADKMGLFFGGKILQDNKSISQCKLNESSLIYLVHGNAEN